MVDLDLTLPEEVEFDLLDKSNTSIYKAKVTLYLPTKITKEQLGDSFFRVIDSDKIIGSMKVPDESWRFVTLTTSKMKCFYTREELDRFNGLKEEDLAIDPMLNARVVKRRW